MKDACRPSTVEHIFPWHPTHLVPALYIHLQFFNEVACYLTMAHSGCPVQRSMSIISSVMDLHPKSRRQELYHLQVTTFCSQVQSVAAVLGQQCGKQCMCTRLSLKLCTGEEGHMCMHNYAYDCNDAKSEQGLMIICICMYDGFVYTYIRIYLYIVL